MTGRLLIRHITTWVLLVFAILPMNHGAHGSARQDPPLNAVHAAIEASIVDTVRVPGTDIRFRMRLVPSGSFLFGSPPEEHGRRGDEGPQVRLEMSSFWIMEHEVTVGTFTAFRYRERDSDSTYSELSFDADAVSRPSPPYEDPYHGMGHENHPATGMTQWSAVHFARWLSDKTGEFFRLPTEAEWEYACRAGSDSPFGVADEPAALGEFAWYVTNSGEKTHAVGEKAPNPWHLYDMNGNVSEWTLGQYSVNFHEALTAEADSTGVVRDPWDMPDRPRPRTVKGGAFDDDADALRCAARTRSSNDWKRRDPQLPKSRWWNTDSPFLGFRLVRPVDPPSAEQQAAFWSLNLGEE